MDIWYYHLRIPILLVQSAMGMGIFGYGLKRRNWFTCRFILSLVAGFTIVCVYRFAFFQDASVLQFGFGRWLGALIMFLVLMCIAWFCYDESFWTAAFIASSGYIVQDIAGSLKMWLRLIPEIDRLAAHSIGVLAVDMFVYGGTYLLMYFIFRPYTREPEKRFDSKIKAFFSILVIIFTISMARMTQGNPERNAVAQAAESIYQIICGVFILFLQFGVMERAKLENDIDAMKELGHEQYEQYRHSKQAVELVNEKYHDLKGLLENFQGEFPMEQFTPLKTRLEEYEIHIDTGSRVLDIVLTEKMALCQKRGIELTCLASGSGLDFFEELDLYSLVGNVLNNAIDAVSKLPKDGRFISLKTGFDGQMFTLHVENPFSGKLMMKNDFPVSQRDSRYHGFGMKSMQRIVGKYAGALTVEARDGIFLLDAILFKP